MKRNYGDFKTYTMNSLRDASAALNVLQKDGAKVLGIFSTPDQDTPYAVSALESGRSALGGNDPVLEAFDSKLVER